MRASPCSSVVERFYTGFCWETAPVCRLTRVIGLVTYTASTLDRDEYPFDLTHTNRYQDNSGAGGALPGGPNDLSRATLGITLSSVRSTASKKPLSGLL